MGLFDSFDIKKMIDPGGLILKGEDFDPLDTDSYRQYASDVDRVRDIAGRDITGLDAGGMASRDLAQTVYGNQLDQLNQQAGSNLATSVAGANRYGSDAGSYERMANNNMRNTLMGHQSLGQTNMQNQADILSQNIGQQQNMQNTALMGLPQMSAMPFQTSVTAKAGNEQANKAQGMGIGSTLGTVVGGIYGGPVGASAGGAVGGQVGGNLFS